MKTKYLLIITIIASIALLTLVAFFGSGSAYSAYDTDPAKEPFFAKVFKGAGDGVFPWSKGGEVADENADAEDDESSDEEVTDTADASDAESASSDTGESAESTEDDADEAAASEPITEIPESSSHAVSPAKDYGVASERYLAAEGTTFEYDTEGIFAPTGEFRELGSVDDEYLEDALFVGDSRTVGLCDYGGIKGKTSFLAKEGFSIYDVEDDEMPFVGLEDEEGEYEEGDYKLYDLLEEREYTKIYISLGINELGVPDTTKFYNTYREVLTKIRELAPDAYIYIQGIMHVSISMSQSDEVFNNTVIVERNTAIASLANGYDIFYLDINPALCDDDGNLKDEFTGDSIHLKAKVYPAWVTFIEMFGALYGDEASSGGGEGSDASSSKSSKKSSNDSDDEDNDDSDKDSDEDDEDSDKQEDSDEDSED